MKHMLVLFVGLAVVLVPVMTGCGGQQSPDGAGAGPEGQTPEPAAVDTPEDNTGEQAAPEASANPEDMPAPADEMEKDAAEKSAGRPEKIDDATIVGTVWQHGDFKFSFEADGVVKLNDAIPGTWKIEGDNLTVSVMGQEQQAKIEGNKLTYNGAELEFLQ